MWLSLVEHLVRDEGVGGSNPLIPTSKPQGFSAFTLDRKIPDFGDLIPRKKFGFFVFKPCQELYRDHSIFLYFLL
jgi:hypothetical protein